MAGEKKQANLKKIKELVDLMIDNNLIELEMVDGDSKILLKRPAPGQPCVTQVPMPAAPAEQRLAEPSPKKEKDVDDGLIEVKSPMVGTFYASPSPDSKPFVTVGTRVEPDTVVCIIEAMKVMNEIKAETAGTIAEVLCKAGQALEYGQVLFKVKPD